MAEAEIFSRRWAGRHSFATRDPAPTHEVAVGAGPGVTGWAVIFGDMVAEGIVRKAHGWVEDARVG
jgi:hypothetical protein